MFSSASTPWTDFSRPDSSVHGISQARILERVAMSFSRRSQPKNQTHISYLASKFFTTEPLGKPIETLKTPWSCQQPYPFETWQKKECRTFTALILITFPVLTICAQWFSPVWLSAATWTIAWQAPLPMEFSRQEYWSGVPFHIPEDLPDPGIKPVSIASPALAGWFFTILPPGKPDYITSLFTRGCGGHRSWGSHLLCSPFPWQRNKATLSFPIILFLYFCLAVVHREPRFWHSISKICTLPHKCPLSPSLCSFRI